MSAPAASGPRPPRFFVPPESFVDGRASLRGALAHQLRHVLRLRPGERIILLDDTGIEYETVLDTVSADQCEGRIVAQRTSPGEPQLRLTLCAALLKQDKFEWLLQKGVELGVAAFQPLVTERCVAGEVGASRLERWRRIVVEAAEQSERGRIPVLTTVQTFGGAIVRAAQSALALIAYEGERDQTLQAVLRAHAAPSPTAINFFVGPEGGFAPAEIELARAHGVVPVTLGPRILRGETASLAAAAAIFYELGQ